MKNTIETRIGVFVAIVAVAAVLLLITVGGLEQFAKGHTFRAQFSNVQELKVGDRVKMAGVEIGQVKHIGLTNDQVLVTMKIFKADDSAKVKTSSKATVRFAGLLGQNFVAISFGNPGDPSAAEGTILEGEQQADLNAIMQKVDNVATGAEKLFSSFSGEKIDNLLGPFTDFLKANRGPLTATIANVQAISTQISQGKGTVGKLIYDESLYNSALSSITNLQSAADEIKLTVGEARKIVDQANAGEGTVGKLLKDDTLYRETTSSMTNLKEILQKINRGQGSVGKLVNDQEFYRNAKLTLQKLDKATEGLEDQGPLSILGIVANNLF